MATPSRDSKTGKFIKGKRVILKSERDRQFWNYVEFIPFTDCWEWIGPITERGYGRIHIGNHKYSSAHRYSLGMVEKLDPELVIDHKCRNRSCVNPKHLRQVTQYVNTIENSKSVGATNKIKTHCKYGHEFTKENTGINCNGGRWCKICNKERHRK